MSSSFLSRNAYFLYKVRNPYGQAAGCFLKRQTAFFSRRWLPRLPRGLMKEVCIYSLRSLSPFITPRRSRLLTEHSCGAPVGGARGAPGPQRARRPDVGARSHPSPVERRQCGHTTVISESCPRSAKENRICHAGRLTSRPGTDVGRDTPVRLPFGRSHNMVTGR